MLNLIYLHILLTLVAMLGCNTCKVCVCGYFLSEVHPTQHMFTTPVNTSSTISVTLQRP